MKPSLLDSQSLTAFPFVKGECCNCSIKDRWLLHNVVVRGVDRRICTSCVLLLHPSSFCPRCFEFYENPLSTTSSAHRFVSCIKCSSLTHIHCLSSPPPPSYLCPPCSQPSFTFFPVPESPVDEKLAKVFLCACKVATSAMKKQFTLSRIRSERAVKEAAVARKRTKEAIEHVFELQKPQRSIGLSNNNNVVVKIEDLNGFGGGHSQLRNSPLISNVGANGIGSPMIGGNGSDGRIGNNGSGKLGASFKAF